MLVPVLVSTGALTLSHTCVTIVGKVFILQRIELAISIFMMLSLTIEIIAVMLMLVKIT